MKRNQPPKKTVVPACDMTFVKSSHDDAPPIESSNRAHRNTFEPCCSEDCRLHKESLDKLLDQIEKTVPNTGLQQSCHTRAPTAEVPLML